MSERDLALYPWTPVEREYHEALAERAVRRKLDDPLEVLQMLGLAPYKSGRPPRKPPKTPVKHGERSGYTNRGCGKPGSPPCPASPSCKDMDRAYWRERRKTDPANYKIGSAA